MPRDIMIVASNIKKMQAQNAPDSDIDQYVTEEGYSPDSFMTEYKAAKQRSSGVGMPEPPKSFSPMPEALKQAAISALAGPVQAARVGMTPEGQGVGQGAIQGATFGYGMPALRGAADVLNFATGGKGASEQLPEPTAKEAIVGNLLGGTSFGPSRQAMDAISKVPFLLKPIAAAAAGFAFNPSESKVETDINKRLPAAALGGALAVPGAIAEVAAKMVKPESIRALTKALKPRNSNINFEKDAEIALPVIQDAAKKTGNKLEGGIDDFIQLNRQAKKDTWGKIQNAFKSAKEKPSNSVSGDEVIKGMEGLIDPEMQELSPGFGDTIKKVFDNYKGKEITIGGAEKRLQVLNSELGSYFKSAGRSSYEKGMQENINAMLAERQILRKVLYDKIQNLTGENIEPLKRQYGALINMEDAALKRQIVSNRQAPVSLQESINYIWGATSLISGNPAGALPIAASYAVKKLNDSDRLVREAVKNVGKGRVPLAAVSSGAGISAGANINKKSYSPPSPEMVQALQERFRNR